MYCIRFISYNDEPRRITDSELLEFFKVNKVELIFTSRLSIRIYKNIKYIFAK